MILAISWGRLERIQTGGFLRVGYHAAMWFAMCGAVFSFPRLGRKQALLLIGISAILVRLAFWQAPVSDDVNRYLWEGSLIWKGENPYAAIADDECWAEHRDQYWEEMNHRDRLTAYPPGMELVMAGASWVWYDLRVFKIVALAGDLWILGVLMLLFRDFRKPLRWLCFYVFNPIILVSFAAEGHFDSLMVGAILTALLMAHRKRWAWAWLWLGVAVQMKLIVIILLPYFLVRGDWKKGWPFVLTLVVPSLFFGEHLWQGVAGVLGFGKDGAFNGGLFETFRLVGIPDSLARNLGAFLFIAVGSLFGWRTLRSQERDLISLSFVVLSALIVCSPVVHFWYLSWLIPLVALRPSLSWIVLCLTSSLYFMAWGNLEAGRGWGYHRGWVMVTWWPFFLLALWEFRFFWKRLNGPGYAEATSVDLVVPVYNAGGALAPFLKRLREVSPEAGTITVVDGGSTDDSVALARSSGDHVISSERGRGAQIAAGLEASSADLLAIIHADTQPLVGWIPHLREVAQANPKSPAFALGQRYDECSLGLLMVEVLNEARATFGGPIFGDQTLIVRRDALERIGGFPTQPLMEDVEISWRLLERGRISYLGAEWSVSAQKWEGRFVGRFRQVISLMIRYRWARWKSPQAAAEFSKKLYREYYRQK